MVEFFGRLGIGLIENVNELLCGKFLTFVVWGFCDTVCVKVESVSRREGDRVFFDAFVKDFTGNHAQGHAFRLDGLCGVGRGLGCDL